MKAYDEIRFTVRVDSGDPSAMAGFLDMLRYDAAQVRDWSVMERPAHPRDGAVYNVSLSAREISAERWRSFGLVPRVNGHPVE